MAFDLPDPGPPTAEDLALGQAYEWLRRSAEEWFIKMRAELGHSRLDFQVVVLKPICEDCCARLGLRTLLEHVSSGGKSEIVILLPEEVMPERLRLYDRATKSLHLWPPSKPYRDPHRVSCSMCGQTVGTARGNDIIRVIEEPFADHFGFPDEGPKRKRGKAERRRILELYGFRCFECGARLDENDFTLDHIVPKSEGGPTVSLNLQPLCHRCNQEKRDSPVKSVKIALDMLLRPAPADSYSDLIW
jgi:5-methylcytosine-specific restriction endonuclease McrA